MDYIRNGVTTGGFAPNTPLEPQGDNIYNQYLQQVWQERQDAINKNNELLNNTDLSKVDPRDRGAVQGMYDKWKQLAMSPPQTMQRGAYNAWKEKVLSDKAQLQNRIGEAVAARQAYNEAYSRVKDNLTNKGISQFNKDYSSPIFDDNGKVTFPNPDNWERKPEDIFDTDQSLLNFQKRFTEGDKVQLDTHKDKNGRVVQTFARALPVNQYVQSAIDEYNSNPKAKYAWDNQYQQFKDLNPGTQETVQDFIKDAALTKVPQQLVHDKATLQGIKDLTPGIHYYDTETRLHNDPRININAQSFTDKQNSWLADYDKHFGDLSNAVKTGNQSLLSNSVGQFAPLLKGKNLGYGTIVDAQSATDDNGQPVIRTKVLNQWGVPQQQDMPLKNANTWQGLQMLYNNQPKLSGSNFRFQIPNSRLDQHTDGLFKDQQPDYDSPNWDPFHTGLQPNQWQQQPQPAKPVHQPPQQQLTPPNNQQQPQQPVKQKGILGFGKRIVNKMTGSNNTTDNSQLQPIQNTGTLDSFQN